MLSKRFRQAMAGFPSGVTIVTTVEADGTWRGFTATSFCSVSASPPLVAVCLAKSATCHAAFMEAATLIVNILQSEHSEIAIKFATRGVDKFADEEFAVHAHYGIPVLESAAVKLACRVRDRHDGGDHTVLVGEVEDAKVSPSEPIVYYQRQFRRLQPAG